MPNKYRAVLLGVGVVVILVIMVYYHNTMNRTQYKLRNLLEIEQKNREADGLNDKKTCDCAEIEKRLEKKLLAALNPPLIPKATNTSEIIITEKTNDFEMEVKLIEYIQQVNVKCNIMKRMGKTGDGGWDICLDTAYTLKKDQCLVYSFGINGDWSFDDAIVKDFGCTVHSFDPSMKNVNPKRGNNIHFHEIGISGSNTDGEWKLRTLKTFREMFGHTDKTLDIFKMDVEGAEWKTLPTMIKDGDLKSIKQFLFEIHFSAKQWDRKYMNKIYTFLKDVEGQGFKKFHAHENPRCRFKSPRTNHTKSHCYELYYINTKYLE